MLWRVLVKALVRTMGVEVVHILLEHSPGVPLVVDQEPVGAFFADGADESLGIAVRPWRLGRSLDDLHVLGDEDRVEC